MKVLAGEGAPHGILVNGMLVGLIDSDQHVRRHAREGSNVSYDEFRTKMGANVPVGRVGKAEEFAAMACFLCSDLAGFTTGTAINMDGGAQPGGVTSGFLSLPRAGEVWARVCDGARRPHPPSPTVWERGRKAAMRRRSFRCRSFDCVVFGATGDLTLRKLLPALYYRFARRPDDAEVAHHRRRAVGHAATTAFASAPCRR